MAVILCKTCGEPVEIDDVTGRGQCKKCKNIYEVEKKYITSEEFKRIVIDDTVKLPNIIDMIRSDCRAENYADALNECKKAREIKASDPLVKFYYALSDFKVNDNAAHLVEYLRENTHADMEVLNEILPILFSVTDNDLVIQALPKYVNNLYITDEMKQLWINEYQIKTYAKDDIAKKVYIALSPQSDEEKLQLFRSIYKQCKTYTDYSFIMKILIKKSNKVSKTVLTLFFIEALNFLRGEDFSNKEHYIVIKKQYLELKHNFEKTVKLGFNSPEVYKSFLNMQRSLEISQRSYKANLKKQKSEARKAVLKKAGAKLLKFTLYILLLLIIVLLFISLFRNR